MEPSAAKKMSFFQQVASLPANFWYANILEMMERLAYFSVAAIRALYVVAATSNNGLGLSYPQKGLIFGIWAFLQCLIPMVSGGYTDRYGYRKSLAVAFTINIVGYVLMALSRPLADSLGAQGLPDAGFWVFLVAACLVATGTAIFKPPVQATIARATTEQTSSIGWGLFYWVVNIGGTLAPICAALLRGENDWQIVFYAAAIVTALNFLPAFLLYKEPEKVPSEAGDEPAKGPFGVLLSSLGNIVKDARFVVFLLICSCFWLMFMQLWDLLPNFIDEWVDTSDVAGVFGAINSNLILESGQTKPEMIINIDSFSIVLLVIPISFLISRLHKVAAMVIGMMIALAGFVGAGLTSIGWICCLMIFIFAVGEMVCSPTFSAYIGLIAPKGKKALYMGYSNVPFAIGWGFGNLVSGYLYEELANKFKFAREYMVAELGASPSFALNKELLPKDQVMQTMTNIMAGGDPAALQSAMTGLNSHVNETGLSGDELQMALKNGYAEILGQTDYAAIRAATDILWDLHHPYVIWVYLGAVGLVGALGMMIFYFAIKKSIQPSETDPANNA